MRFVRKDYVYFYEAGIVCYRSTPISVKKLSKSKDFNKKVFPEGEQLFTPESDFHLIDEVPLPSISLVEHRPLDLLTALFQDNAKENKTDEDKLDHKHTKEFPSLLNWSKGAIKYLKPRITESQDFDNDVILKTSQKIDEQIHLIKKEENTNRTFPKLDEQDYYVFNSLQKTTEKRTIELLINRSYLNRRKIRRDIFDVDAKDTDERYQTFTLNVINEEEDYPSDQLEKITTITESSIEKLESDINQEDVTDTFPTRQDSETSSLFGHKTLLTNEEIRTVIDSPNVIKSLESFNYQLSRLSTNKTCLQNPEIFTNSLISHDTGTPFYTQTEDHTDAENSLTVKLSVPDYKTSTESSTDSLNADGYLQSIHSQAISDFTSEDSIDQFFHPVETELSLEDSKLPDEIESRESIQPDPSVKESITSLSSITQQASSEIESLSLSGSDSSNQNFFYKEKTIDTTGEEVDDQGPERSKTDSIKTSQSQSNLKDVELASVHEEPPDEYRIIDRDLEDNLYSLDTLFGSLNELPKTHSDHEESLDIEVKKDQKDEPIEQEIAKPEEEVIRPLKDIRNKILVNGFTATVYIVNSNKTATSSICKILFDYENDTLIIKSTNNMFEIKAEGLLSEEIPTLPGSPILLKITLSANKSSAIVVQSEVAHHLELLSGTIGWVNEKSRAENPDKDNLPKMKIRKSLFTGLKRKEKREKEEEPETTEEKETKPRRGLFSRLRNRRNPFRKGK